ncbi:MAG: hypothetical protein KDA47_02580, partial [Planctomycetales bacterium]|nr:hypothetical protein [Planctomycetales bacterium]
MSRFAYILVVSWVLTPLALAEAQQLAPPPASRTPTEYPLPSEAPTAEMGLLPKLNDALSTTRAADAPVIQTLPQSSGATIGPALHAANGWSPASTGAPLMEAGPAMPLPAVGTIRREDSNAYMASRLLSGRVKRSQSDEADDLPEPKKSGKAKD